MLSKTSPNRCFMKSHVCNVPGADKSPNRAIRDEKVFQDMKCYDKNPLCCKPHTFSKKSQERLAPLKDKRGYAHDIVRIMLEFRHAPFMKLSNKYLATRVGCCTRSVIRWTNWLCQNGYITKSQNNIFSINDYKLCEELVSDTKYEAYINSLPEKKIDISISTIFHTETVTPIRSLIKYNNYLYTRNPYSTRMTHAHARAVDGDGYGYLTKRQREYRNGTREKLQMVAKEVREWIKKLPQEEITRNILRDNRFGLVSPVMREIIDAFKVPEEDYLKLVAFDESVLKAAWAMTKKVSGIKNPMAFLLKACKEHARQQNFTPEWNWYYNVCEILQIPVHKVDDEPDERPSDMYKRPEPSHVKPNSLAESLQQVSKRQGISLKSLEREQRAKLQGEPRLQMLKQELQRAVCNMDHLEQGFFYEEAKRGLVNRIQSLKEEIQELERNLHG